MLRHRFGEKLAPILTPIMVCDSELNISKGVCIVLNMNILRVTTACCLGGLTQIFFFKFYDLNGKDCTENNFHIFFN